MIPRKYNGSKELQKSVQSMRLCIYTSRSGFTSSLGIWRCEVSGEPVGLRTVKKGSIQRHIHREAKLAYKLPRIMTRMSVKQTLQTGAKITYTYMHACMFIHTYIHSYMPTYMCKISSKYFHKLCMTQMQEYIWKEIIVYRQRKRIRSF